MGGSRIVECVRLYWVASSAFLFAATLLSGIASAQAQRASDVRPGEIVILRDVDPRNALNPGTGQPHTVDVMARPEWFGSLMTIGDQIDDRQAANIASGPANNGARAISGSSELGALRDTQSVALSNGNAARSGDSGLGASITSTITGAMGGVLGGLPGGGRP
jgi:hypothetical protein